MTALVDELEADLSWREAELASLKRLAIVNSHNEITHRATLRACWALLYAHFEGFTKFTWEYLLDNIENQGVAIKNLSLEFRILALENVFRKLRGDLSSASLLDFFESNYSSELEKNALFHEDCRLQTDSNLWPNVFERECSRIGIKSDALNFSRTRIKSLVARRNEIAHGKNMTIRSVDEYTEYESAAFNVLHDLAVQVLDAIEEQSYILPT